jgi:indolepyruvate ferredoxin oxidoreductase beta subunit
MDENGKVVNIFLCGVGGQGTILASNILCEVFLGQGFDVKKAEVHGMAQRGGDVTTHFRFGKKVYSPLIKYGDVDFLIAFEMLEAGRYINWLKADGRVIINKQEIPPPAVSSGKVAYPEDIERLYKKYFKGNVWLIHGLDMARELGNIQAANVILIGAASNFFPHVSVGAWTAAIEKLMDAKYQKLNIEETRYMGIVTDRSIQRER